MARPRARIIQAESCEIERCAALQRSDNPGASPSQPRKPWRDCIVMMSASMGENGLLLTPSIDHLFDRGVHHFRGLGLYW